MLLSTLLLLGLLLASCSNILAPERPPLLIEGLTLPPGATMQTRVLNLTKEYPKGGGKAKRSEMLTAEFLPRESFDEVLAWYEGQLSTKGFKPVPQPDFDRTLGMPEDPRYESRRAEFINEAKALRVVLNYSSTEFSYGSTRGNRRITYRLRVVSGPEALKKHAY